MEKVRVLLVASALLIAGCGGGAVLSSAKAKPVTVAQSVQISTGANASSDRGNVDLNRPNPPISKGAKNQSAAPAQPAAVTPVAPGGSVATDRCTAGFGSGQGNQLAPGGKHPPLPMCAPQ